MKSEPSNFVRRMIARMNRISTVLIVVVGLCTGITVWMLSAAEIKNMCFDNEEVQSLPGKFLVNIGGEEASLTLPAEIDGRADEPIILTRRLERSEIEGNSLLLYVKQAWVNIYLGDELLNGSDSDAKLPFKMSPCSYWYICRIPYDFDQEELRIEITYSKDQYAKELPQVYMGTKAAFLYMIIEQAGFSIMMGVTAIILGISLIIAGFLMRIRRLSRRMRRLGMLALTISIWNLLESRISQLFMGNQPVAVYILFSCFYLIPVAAAAFLLTYPSIARRRYMHGLFWASLGYFVLVQALQINGLAYFIDMVTGMHILAGAIVAGVVLCYFGIKRKKEENVDYSVYIAIMLFGVFVAVDMIQFYLTPIESIGRFSRVGLLVFIFYLGYSAIRQVSEQQRQVIKQQLYKELAFNDMMTGLANRTAFEQEMSRLRESGEPQKLCILMADLNNLKYINDNFGHSQGDSAIIRTAHTLLECFEEPCKCFRIGGDEFCVIGEEIDKTDMEQMHQRFLAKMQEHDEATDYPLSVASAYKASEGTGIDDCFKQADTLMYRIKTQIKRG